MKLRVSIVFFVILVINTLSVYSLDISIRPLIEEDLVPIHKALAESKVTTRTSNIPYPLSMEQVRSWYQTTVEGSANKTLYPYSIVGSEPGKFERDVIGFIEIRKPTALIQEGELGYWLSYEHWGKGYMTKAIEQVTRLAFGQLELTKLQAYVLVDNYGSIKALNKNGFLEVAKGIEKNMPARNRIGTFVLMELIKRVF